MRKVRNQKGFTIMELMIVIVIIGILIAIAVPAYQNFRARAQATACKANQRTVQSAVGLYYADNGAYPATLGALWPATGTKYLDGPIGCSTPNAPASGVLSVDSGTGKVTCSIAAHNAATP